MISGEWEHQSRKEYLILPSYAYFCSYEAQGDDEYIRLSKYLLLQSKGTF